MGRKKVSQLKELGFATTMLVVEGFVLLARKLLQGDYSIWSSMFFAAFNVLLATVAAVMYKSGLERKRVSLLQAVSGGGSDAAHCVYAVVGIVTAYSELAFIIWHASFFRGYVEFVPFVLSLLIFALNLYEAISVDDGVTSDTATAAAATSTDTSPATANATSTDIAATTETDTATATTTTTTDTADPEKQSAGSD